MAKTKKTKEKSLESILFDCRNTLRGKVSSLTNRDAVMGLVFLKFAGDKFEKRRSEIKEQYGDIPTFLEKPSFYLSENVFYLRENCRWSEIVKNAGAKDIANKIDQAMADIETDNSPLKGALLQKFYANLGLDPKVIKSLIDDINQISEEKFKEKDLIGTVYEYFMRNFAYDSKQEKGEFYTPKCIVDLIAELIEPFQGRIYDPCCGTGGMFVQSVKFVEAHNGNKMDIAVYGQEENPDTYRLAKQNLAIRGISCDLGDRNASSFLDDRHEDLKVDYIMANPPFNLKKWRDPNDLLNDPRWSGYGIPPVSNANYAWILHMLSKLDVTDGIAGFLLANGALSSPEELAIRTQLIENDKVEAIIVLPREMFYLTDISVTLWIINNNKKASSLNGRQVRNRENEILFVDLRTWNKLHDDNKAVVFNDEIIQKVKKIYNDWQSLNCPEKYEQPELYRSVKKSEIIERGYTLVPSKYIEFVDKDLDINYEEEMSRIQKEMQEILNKEQKSQDLLKSAFEGIGYAIK